MIDGGVAIGDHVRPVKPSRDGHTGEIATGARADLDAFESAEKPETNSSLATLSITRLTGRRWSLWLLGRSIRSRPIPSAVAIAFLLVGTFGEGHVPLSETALTGLVLVGLLLLVYLGRTGLG